MDDLRATADGANADPRRILLVEDDPNLAAGLRYNLERDGYEVSVAVDGAGGLAQLDAARFDLVVLDLMLPGIGGFEVLETLRGRGSTVPVFILSARDAEVDKVRGFDLGAVDYVTKPFGLGELLARIRVRLGGDALTAQAGRESTRIDLATGRVDLDHRTFEPTGSAAGGVMLTPLEVEVLRILREGRGAPVEREALCRRIWGLGSGATRTLDAHVARLRKKLEADPAQPCHLVTVHGVGYKLVTS